MKDTPSVERRWLIAAAFLVLAFKLWLSSALPVTGDEGEFISYGVYPDYGDYDHPPMIGWWLYPLLQVSHAAWVLRLPVTLLPVVLAGGIYFVLRSFDDARAALAALAFLLVPVNVWAVFITPDTPLIFFSFLSALCFWRALLRRTAGWYALSGIFLGLAFLSKYFAVLLALAFVAYVATARHDERDWRGLAVTLLCALPFAAVNLWWNYEHCWTNVMFNFLYRHDGLGHDNVGWSWKTPLLYAVSILYVVSPLALWRAIREREELKRILSAPGTRFFAVVFLVPIAVFAALSLAFRIGLHWVLSFTPFFFLALAPLLSRRQWLRSVIFLGIFSIVHVAAFTVALRLPLDTWKSIPFYRGIVYNFRIHDILRELRPYEKEFEFGTGGLSSAMIASFYSDRHFIVFGAGYSHGRQDDILTDFRSLDGKNILVLRATPPEDSKYRPYFKSIDYRSFTLDGQVFHIVLGRGFDYAAYREGILEPLRQRYYAIPWFLPQGRCYFCERYFGATVCPTEGSVRG